MTLDMIS